MTDYVPVGMYAQFFRVEGVHVKESSKSTKFIIA